MERSEPDVILHGVIGALIAGAVVAAWFLVVDVAAGTAFQTPARLASIVLREEYRGPWPRLIVMYTILHFGVFVSLGLVSAWFLKQIDVDPGLLIGAVFGIGVLNAVHYAGLLVTGTNFLTVIPVAHVVGANLLGGMLMMAYLHRAFRAESPFGWNVLKRYPTLYNGLVTGLIGAAAVAFWFFVVDMATSKPFYTPAALGSALLLGAAGPDEVQFNLGVMLAYSFLHIAAFAAVGIVFAWLAGRAALAPGFWMRAAAVFVVVEALFLGTLSIVSGWVVHDLGWLTILVANALAVTVMGVAIWRRGPHLGKHLVEEATPG